MEFVFTFTLAELLAFYENPQDGFYNPRLCLNIAKMAETNTIHWRSMDFPKISDQFKFQWENFVLHITNNLQPDDYFQADNLGEFDVWNRKTRYCSKAFKETDWFEYRIKAMQRALKETGNHEFIITIFPVGT